MRHFREIMFFALLILMPPRPAAAAPLFDCPDLHNKQKMSLGEMTQGEDGWFFRLGGDLKQDFPHST